MKGYFRSVTERVNPTNLPHNDSAPRIICLVRDAHFLWLPKFVFVLQLFYRLKQISSSWSRHTVPNFDEFNSKLHSLGCLSKMIWQKTNFMHCCRTNRRKFWIYCHMFLYISEFTSYIREYIVINDYAHNPTNVWPSLMDYI